jgi:uncharacterized protein YndB with AHSA1/START domain
MIEKTVLLPVDVERAFALFTEEISVWWPPERRHTSDPSSAMFLLASGRFFERASDGREVELGRVRAFEPPKRLLLDWYPGTDAAHPTEVEVLFVAEGGPESTRVTVHHRPTPASEALYPTRAPRYAGSWDLVLAALAKRAVPLLDGN